MYCWGGWTALFEVEGCDGENSPMFSGFCTLFMSASTWIKFLWFVGETDCVWDVVLFGESGPSLNVGSQYFPGVSVLIGDSVGGRDGRVSSGKNESLFVFY